LQETIGVMVTGPGTHICLIVTFAGATVDGVVEESSGGSFAIATFDNSRRR